MPKFIDSAADPTQAAEEAIEDAAEAVERAAVRKLLAALDDDDGQLLVYMRIDNNRLEYSIINRPDPTMSGVTDAVLLSAILIAGRRYNLKREKKLPHKERVKAARGDGSASEIVYKDRVVIDFAAETMTSTRKRDLTLKALSIVVQNLSDSVAKAAAAQPAAKPN